MNDRPFPGVSWLARLYGLALRLYPLGVRREYAQEMQAVFYLNVNHAARQGGFRLVYLACREARDLPRAIVRAHLDERKMKMKLVAGDDVRGAPLNTWKIAAVFLPFALALFVSVFSGGLIDWTFSTVLGYILAGLIVAICIAGLVTRLPVWALPSLGLVFIFVYEYFIKRGAESFLYYKVMRPLYGGWPDDLGLKIGTLLLISLISILLMTIVIACLFLLVRRFRDRVRQDWTLLSFFFYGMAIVPLFLDDEFHHLWPYQSASLLLMAAGAGLYLKFSRRWQQILALAIPVVLTQLLFILGLYRTYPLETWSSLGHPEYRIWEALQPLSDPLLAFLLLPALITLFPLRKKAEQTPSEEPVLPDVAGTV